MSRTSFRSRGSSYCSICEEIRRKKTSLNRETRRHSVEHDHSYDRDNHRLDFNHHHHHTHDDYLDHNHHHHEHHDSGHHHEHDHGGSGHHHHRHNHERWTILPWPMGGRRSEGSLHGGHEGHGGGGGGGRDHREKIEIIVKQQPAGAGMAPIVVKPPVGLTEEQRRLEAETLKEIDLLKRITKQQEMNRQQLTDITRINEITREKDIDRSRYRDEREPSWERRDRDRDPDREREPDRKRDPDNKNYDKRSKEDRDLEPKVRRVSRGTQDDQPLNKDGPGPGPGRRRDGDVFIFGGNSRSRTDRPPYRISEGAGSNPAIPVASGAVRQDPRTFQGSEIWTPDPVTADDDDPPVAAAEQRRRPNPDVATDPETGRPLPMTATAECYNCHKGRFVKKFTWTGIIAALICFPCGIYYCFKMRAKVCSYCGILESENENERENRNRNENRQRSGDRNRNDDRNRSQR